MLMWSFQWKKRILRAITYTNISFKLFITAQALIYVKNYQYFYEKTEYLIVKFNKINGNFGIPLNKKGQVRV